MGASRSCWNGTTSAFQPEEITSKGLEFHVCTINKKCPYEKSLGTYRMHLVSQDSLTQIQRLQYRALKIVEK